MTKMTKDEMDAMLDVKNWAPHPRNEEMYAVFYQFYVAPEASTDFNVSKITQKHLDIFFNVESWDYDVMTDEVVTVMHDFLETLYLEHNVDGDFVDDIRDLLSIGDRPVDNRRINALYNRAMKKLGF